MPRTDYKVCKRYFYKLNVRAQRRRQGHGHRRVVDNVQGLKDYILLGAFRAFEHGH